MLFHTFASHRWGRDVVHSQENKKDYSSQVWSTTHFFPTFSTTNCKTVSETLYIFSCPKFLLIKLWSNLNLISLTVLGILLCMLYWVIASSAMYVKNLVPDSKQQFRTGTMQVMLNVDLLRGTKTTTSKVYLKLQLCYIDLTVDNSDCTGRQHPW